MDRAKHESATAEEREELKKVALLMGKVLPLALTLTLTLTLTRTRTLTLPHGVGGGRDRQPAARRGDHRGHDAPGHAGDDAQEI